MTALLSLLVCLAAQPHVCETVIPDYARTETGAPVTFMECMTVTGQQVALRWIQEHPEYELRRVNCSVASDAERLRAQIRSPEA